MIKEGQTVLISDMTNIYFGNAFKVKEVKAGEVVVEDEMQNEYKFSANQLKLPNVYND